MDNVFPSLEKTVTAMNRAQDVFGFELVDLSVPLGVWHLAGENQTPYLWAERLADRLERMPMELGVEILACVTRHWMCDDDTYNIYAWWSDKRTPPIIIFSIAGFDDLPAEGPQTDRALANAIVSGLAGFYGEMDSHKKGAKDCPMAYDEKRDFNLVVGQQKFDPKCAKTLKPRLRQKYGALEKLLTAFQ